MCVTGTPDLTLTVPTPAAPLQKSVLRAPLRQCVVQRLPAASPQKGTTMNDTSNPQAAADQARKNYREMTSPDGSVPEAVRSMNEKTVAQTREVYDRSKDAFDASVSTLEGTFAAAGQGVVAFNRKFVDIAQ